MYFICLGGTQAGFNLAEQHWEHPPADSSGGDKISDEATPAGTPKLRAMRRAEASQENCQEGQLSPPLGAEK